jgi:hypothetical protein
MSHSQQVAYDAGYKSGYYNVGRSPSQAEREEWSHAWAFYMDGWNKAQKNPTWLPRGAANMEDKNKPEFVDGSCAHEWENTGLVCGSEYVFSCIFCSETATIGTWR